jgi:hypothetical protein
VACSVPVVAVLPSVPSLVNDCDGAVVVVVVEAASVGSGVLLDFTSAPPIDPPKSAATKATAPTIFVLDVIMI